MFFLYIENLFYYIIYIMFPFKYLYVKYFFNKHQVVFCYIHNKSITYVHYLSEVLLLSCGMYIYNIY